MNLILIQFASGQIFTQVQEQVGIDHVYEQQQFTGGGCAFVDINNDGYDDLYINGGKGIDKLYLNDQEGRFTDISFSAGILATGNYYTSGVNAGDVNNDGWDDLFIATTRGLDGQYTRNALFMNQGDNTFKDIWKINSELDNVWSIGSLFIDFDLDGDLDIYVINYIQTSELIKDDAGNTVDFNHTCYSNRMYENLGNLEFQEVSEEVGLDDEGCGLAAVATDFDQDGDLDIYLGNDFGSEVKPNRLFRNDYSTSGRFVDVSGDLQAQEAIYCMGIASGDIDGDLDFDLYMTNNGRNVLLEQQESGYSDVTDIANVANKWNRQDSTLAVSWGTFMADVDNDMDLDIYVANGFVPSTLNLPTEFNDRDHLYLNDGTGIFSEENNISDRPNQFTSRGTAFSDYDNDGDIDICTVVYDRPANLGVPKCIFYENIGNENNWASFQLEGIKSNRNGYGARVIMYAAGTSQVREVDGGSSHCSSNTKKVNFGLGSNTAIDSVLIYWPGNSVPQHISNIPINEVNNILEDTLRSEIKTATSQEAQLYIKAYPNPATDFILIEDLRETNRIEVYDTRGAKINVDTTEINGILKVDLSRLVPGLYFLQVTSPKGTEILQMVKM